MGNNHQHRSMGSDVWQWSNINTAKNGARGQLGWEFRFLVPISGTPIVSGIPIPFSIPKIPVGFFFEIPVSGESENQNSDLQYSEFW
jgi:hypothetical protein